MKTNWLGYKAPNMVPILKKESAPRLRDKVRERDKKKKPNRHW
jgi:hypothetical protein